MVARTVARTYWMGFATNDGPRTLGRSGLGRDVDERAPGIPQKEADGGDADGATLHAGGSVLLGDAAQCQYRNGFRLIDRGAQSHQPLPASRSLLRDLFEDRRKE